jgi:hypothetical protein
MGTWYWTQVN